MKKAIHLRLCAIIAGFAIIFSSCSKSSLDLAPNDQPAKTQASSSIKTGKFVNSPFNIGAWDTEIMNFINQPYEVKLGLFNSYLMQGEVAVFYLILSDDVSKETIDNPTLFTSDADTEEKILDYTMISYQEAGNYGINVPYELSNTPFMFAIIEMGEEYTGKTINLHSEITVRGDMLIADLNQAFKVKPKE
ncbi:MAG TPA: hypothetical protein VN451_09405 [Chitinophagaceae bacterium]|nr:hypothetical protein [Chitinophagaceae bacterium]